MATNPGLPTSPLRDAASGGELSRIMLALIGLGARSGERTLVFDEVDAGIGGFTARAVGERLRALAASGQCSASPTCRRSRRWPRPTSGSRSDASAAEARATVERVAGDELVAEIVRMLGAERDDAAASTPRARAARGCLSRARAALAAGRIISRWPLLSRARALLRGPEIQLRPRRGPDDRRPRAARAAGPRTSSSGSARATSRSSTTPTSTGSPPRTWSRAGCGRSSTSPSPRPAATRTRAAGPRQGRRRA